MLLTNDITKIPGIYSYTGKNIKEILEAKGGFICSDTEDFEPMFTAETIL